MKDEIVNRPSWTNKDTSEYGWIDMARTGIETHCARKCYYM